MKFEDVKKIGIVGGGVMGGGIAQVMAIGGYEVIVRDLTDEVIEATKGAIFDSRWGMKRFGTARTAIRSFRAPG